MDSNRDNKEGDYLPEESRAEAEILEMEYQNGIERLRQQQDTFQEFSREGMRIFRLLLLLVAAPAAILGALSPQIIANLGNVLLSGSCALTYSGGCVPIGWVSISTGALFLISMFLNVAASGYEAHGVRNLTNPNDIDSLLADSDKGKIAYLKEKLHQFQGRIRHNDQIISAEELLLGTGKSTIIFTMYGAASIIYVIVADSSVPVIIWLIGFMISMLPVYWFFRDTPDLYEQQDHFFFGGTPIYDREKDPKEQE